MVTPSAGGIVLVPFPFSDLSQAKLRPAAVLADALSTSRRRASRLACFAPIAMLDRGSSLPLAEI